MISHPKFDAHKKTEESTREKIYINWIVNENSFKTNEGYEFKMIRRGGSSS